jgi:hypothetical protein
MNPLELMRSDIKKGMEREQRRREELAKRKAFRPPQKPRAPNQWLMVLGGWLEKTRPIWPTLAAGKRYAWILVRYAIRDAKKVYSRVSEYARRQRT